MPKIDWKWFIIGLLVAIFAVPFVQAQLSRTLNHKTANKV